jgi:hypothetical protein
MSKKSHAYDDPSVEEAAAPAQHHSVAEITEHLRALSNHLNTQATHNAPITPASLAELQDIIGWVADLEPEPPEP